MRRARNKQKRGLWVRAWKQLKMRGEEISPVHTPQMSGGETVGEKQEQERERERKEIIEKEMQGKIKEGPGASEAAPVTEQRRERERESRTGKKRK
jgi:hypothetical protein